MKIPKRGEKGFTLVELLIVLAILAVLAAVVIPSVTGMLGRGQKQSFETDAKTVQSGVMAYLIDIRIDTETVPDPTPGHYLPVFGWDVPNDNYPGIIQTDKGNLYKIVLDTTPSVPFPEAYQILSVMTWDADNGWVDQGPGSYNTTAQEACAIQMPWLVTTVVDGDPGPYLDDNPDSSGIDNGVLEDKVGSYTWIVDYSGAIFAVYFDGTSYYAGFCDTYP